MNRFLVPLALIVLVAGCSMPGIFGQQSGEPVEADSARTVVVREIYHETPVYYVDTVFMAEEPAPAQPVYVTEEYNEYNDYNETYVSVHEQVVVVPPPPRDRRPGWSPRQHDERPSRPPHDGEQRRPRQGQPESNRPSVTPPPPTNRTNVPVMVERQKSPDRPTPPNQPTPPKRQAPARGGSAPVVAVQIESPKQVPAPPSDRPAVAEPDSVPAQVEMSQARAGLRPARAKR